MNKLPHTNARDELLAFEHLLATLSAGFINVPAGRIDASITDALRRFVELLGTDRSQLIRFAADGGVFVTHSAAVEGVPAAVPQSLSERYPWVIARLRQGSAVAVPRVSALPAEAALDQASWAGQRVQSSLVVPMRVAGRIEGALAFGCLRQQRDWPDDLVERVGLLADIFANTLAHKRAQESLDAALGFERSITDVLAALLTGGAQEQERDRLIENGLRDMAGVFDAERATLWRRVGDKPEFDKSHRWLRADVPPLPATLGSVSIPWISGQLVAAKAVRFARHADLPPAAASDLPALRALYIRSAVIIPLAVAGRVAGALSFANANSERDWPDALIPRMRLVGEVFAGVMARQEAERREQLAQAQAAHAARVGTMGLFAASLVHELTQPLAASLANAEAAAELLEAPSPDLPELRTTLADIVADDRRAGELIQQLRRFLRRGEVERRTHALQPILDDVLRLVAGEAAGQRIVVDAECPDPAATCFGDRVQLQQVLLNLLLNAFDAVGGKPPEARRVTVHASTSDPCAVVEVSDTGRGMDESTLARVFEPFFTTKPAGMGLGLSISRTIVEAHGGRLSVRSSPDRGTTFRVELPARSPGEFALPPRAPETRPVPRDGTVFVIDDDASMRRAIERQLQTAGYAVETFASAQDYLNHPPHAGTACIVSDLRMPGLSGLDLQTSLARGGRELPIVFVSGHGDVSTTVQAMKGGAVGFLSKPFTRDDLLAAVSEALVRSHDHGRARSEKAGLEARYALLTAREQEVCALVAGGLLNKVIAGRLGAAEATVKIHRGRVMEKMGAASVADLVRIVERLNLPPASAAPTQPPVRSARPSA